MAVEIERKFLVLTEDWRGQVEQSIRVRQAYLNREAGLTAREACEKLTEMEIDSDLVASLHHLLDECEAARYGAGDQATQLEAEAERLAGDLLGHLKARKLLR